MGLEDDPFLLGPEGNFSGTRTMLNFGRVSPELLLSRIPFFSHQRTSATIDLLHENACRLRYEGFRTVFFGRLRNMRGSQKNTYHLEDPGIYIIYIHPLASKAFFWKILFFLFRWYSDVLWVLGWLTRRDQTTLFSMTTIPGTWWPPVYKWLFQLDDDSKALHKKCLDIIISIHLKLVVDRVVWPPGCQWPLWSDFHL